jgi:hypothetical protein
LAVAEGFADVVFFGKQGVEPVGLKCGERPCVGLLLRRKAHQPAGGGAAAKRKEKIALQMAPVDHGEKPAAGLHHPDSDVIAQHDRVDEIRAGGLMEFCRSRCGMDDRCARMSADDMGSIDLETVAGRPVGQRRIGQGRAQVRAINPRLAR